MRDGIPLVALVVAIIALVVALAGLFSRSPSAPEEAPEQAIVNAEKRLEKVESQRQAMRVEMAEIAAKAARAIEIGGSGSGPRIDEVDIENKVNAAVDAALRKTLAQQAEVAGAPPPKADPKDRFEEMLQDMDKSLAFGKDKSEALRNTLASLRNDLNVAFRSAEGAERESKARLVRSRSDASLRRILSPAEFESFDKWRAGSKDDYTRKFFGN